jgi:hypothetical protein
MVRASGIVTANSTEKMAPRLNTRPAATNGIGMANYTAITEPSSKRSTAQEWWRDGKRFTAAEIEALQVQMSRRSFQIFPSHAKRCAGAIARIIPKGEKTRTNAWPPQLTNMPEALQAAVDQFGAEGANPAFIIAALVTGGTKIIVSNPDHAVPCLERAASIFPPARKASERAGCPNRTCLPIGRK